MSGDKTQLLLRIGLSVAFIYPAVSAWLNPFAWIGYFPSFMLDFAGTHELFLLHTFGAVEIVLGLWFLYGKKLLLPSIVATLMLFSIVVINWSQMDVVFRDITIAFMSLALFFESLNKGKQQYTQ